MLSGFTKPANLIAAVCVLAAPCLAAEQSKPMTKEERLDMMVKDYPESLKRPRWLEYATNLKKDGNTKYLQRDYGGAQNYYGNAYPYIPEAYSFVMTGDSSLRAILAYNFRSMREKKCLTNKYFPRNLELTVDQHYDIGLALAVRMQDKKFMNSSIYGRAQESSLCLRKLVSVYKAQSKSSCVDLTLLKNCLGEPLIK